MDWTQITIAVLSLAGTLLAARTAGVKDARASVRSGVELGLARGTALLQTLLVDGRLTDDEIRRLVREIGAYSVDASSVLGRPVVKRWIRKTSVFTKYAREALDAIAKRQAERERMQKEAARS